MRVSVLARAAVVADQQSAHSSKKKANHARMCPLNIDSRCILYAFRPMICRLHGLPYTMTIPGHPTTSGSGCHQFHRGIEAPPRIVLERTPLYQALAELERRTRELHGFKGKIKMTVAQIILNDVPQYMTAAVDHRLHS
jgi:hypothetical protein